MILSPLANLIKLLLKLNPWEFNGLAIILSYLFSEGLNYNEQQSLGNFFETIGQSLLTIGQQAQTLDSSVYSDASEILSNIKKKIGNIEEILSDLRNLKF